MSDAVPTGLTSRAEIATAHAGRYLVQLCKHFAHKRPATFGEDSGSIDFRPAGECFLRAVPGALEVRVRATDQAQLAHLQDVVIRHLVRFAFREELSASWSAAEPADAPAG